MSKLKQINKLAMEIVNDETESYRLADMNAQRIVILTQPTQLNEDQQVVLGWLKQNIETASFRLNPIATVFKLHNNFEDSEDDLVNTSYFRLDETQEFQVLQAFAEWGLSDK
ncbi:hypothetical protein ACWOFO_16150 [Carnobacterium maltaromaticum]